MYNHLLYFSYWFINSFFLSFFHYLFPENFALGTWKLTGLEASIYSGFWITFVVWIFWDLILAKDIKLGGTRSFFWFLLANTVGIWITAHMGQFTGFGISNFYLAIILGFVINVSQRLIRKFIVNKI
jgi:hypothetical protein